MHKSSFYTISLLLLSFSAFSQSPGNDPSRARSMPAIGRLYGKVIDAKTRQPVDFATVTLLAMQKDSVISGVLAKANGDFNLEKLPMGRFRLRIGFIGYKTVIQQVMIAPNNLEQDLGNISIEVDNKSLNEVTVQGERSNVVMSVDRRIYTVDKDISARGGTGIDAIKNIPGLTVDADGSVALRNSSPTIFIDGRPTTLTLEQIPADQIERVEVITNPSAKFDASSTGGILNIVLKKNTKPGYNGIITLGAGYPQRYNAMGNLNIKEGRGNLSINYSLNRSFNNTKGYTNRTSLSNNAEIGFYRQDNINEANNLFQNGRIAYDYNITNRSMVTLSQGFTTGGFNTTDEQDFRQTDAGNALISYGDRTTDQETSWRNYSSQIQFRHTYPRRGKEWTTDLTYNRGERKSVSDFLTRNYDGAGQPLGAAEYQKNDGNGNSDNLTFQFDFTNPVTDTAKWEFGVRSNYKSDHSILDVSMLDNNSENYIADTTLSNNYRISDLVNAAYVTYSNMLGGIGYQAGLRFEQTRFSGEILGKNQTFEYFYPDGTKNLAKAFFPSLYLTKRVGEKHEMQLNFARKIKRPGWMEVMPFIMFADKLNYRMGNPNLAPEFMNTIEANYNRIFKNGNFFTALYFKQTEDAITHFSYVLPSDSNILVNTFINGNNSYNYGWENNIKWGFLNRKLDISVNANVFYTTINATSGGVNIENSGFSYNSKAIISYKFPKQYTLQINGNYEGPRIIPQGTTVRVYSMDISLNKEIAKVFSFNLVFNDVFNTRRFGSVFESSTIEQEISRRRETRFVRLSVTWRFGEMDASLFRKRSQKRGEGGGGGMEMEY